MLLCGCMSRVGDFKASMLLIGWIPRYGIDKIYGFFGANLPFFINVKHHGSNKDLKVHNKSAEYPKILP